MGVSASPGPPAERGDRDAVIWHELECGEYRADLPLWRELARRADPEPGSGAILDVGCGTGRVALDLARRGHRVTGVDIDPALLAELDGRARVAGLELETVCCDARELSLPRRDHALCLLPMQTLQLLGGPEGRNALLTRAHRHLRPGGLIACAIVTDVEAFDCAAGDPSPTAETVLQGDRRYRSRATRVEVQGARILIERERTITIEDELLACEQDAVALDRVTVEELEREGAAAGLRPAGERAIAATADHVGGMAVLLRA